MLLAHILDITLFRSITMLCGIDIILQNISTFNMNIENILHNISNPTNIVMDMNYVMDAFYFIVLYREGGERGRGRDQLPWKCMNYVH